MVSWLQDFLAALGHSSSYPLVFNTVLFAILFTVLFGLQLAVAAKPRWRILLLTAFSLFFYWKGAGWFVLLIVATATYDFFLGQAIFDAKDPKKKRLYYYLSLALNLGLLGYFKYHYFFLGTFDLIATGTFTEAPLNWALPLGISFYTFKSLSYIIGLWQEEVEEPESNYLHYLFYVTFFPNILAGPITRASSFLAQLLKPYQLTQATIGTAAFLFITGLFKKVVIADYLAANFIGRVFEYPESFTGLEILIAAYSYGIQLYCDFSGYTDMALAIGLLLGFNLGQNFHEPFKAQNVSDFWRRWHISLSTWFTDYVFTPLNFRWRQYGRWAMVGAVVITFTLSGLWHGPAWTFVLWGLAHGLAIGWDVLTVKSRRAVATWAPKWLYGGISVLLTYSFLAFTYLLFEGKTLDRVGTMLYQLTHQFDGHLLGKWVASYPEVLYMLGLGLLLHFLPTAWKHGLKHRFVQAHWAVQGTAVALGILLIYQFQAAEQLPFKYLQF